MTIAERYDYKNYYVQITPPRADAKVISWLIEVFRDNEFRRGAWVSPEYSARQRYDLECKKVRLQYKMDILERKIEEYSHER